MRDCFFLLLPFRMIQWDCVCVFVLQQSGRTCPSLLPQDLARRRSEILGHGMTLGGGYQLRITCVRKNGCAIRNAFFARRVSPARKTREIDTSRDLRSEEPTSEFQIIM